MPREQHPVEWGSALPTLAERLGGGPQPLLAIRADTKQPLIGHILPLCVPMRPCARQAPFAPCASVSPFKAGANLWPPPASPACPRLCHHPTWWPGWASGGTWQGLSQGDSSRPLTVADRTGGQEPPAGDGTHGARAGHRLVSPQRQRHRQRLGGHHRHGEGLDPAREGGGGRWGSDAEHPPPPCRL